MVEKGKAEAEFGWKPVEQYEVIRKLKDENGNVLKDANGNDLTKTYYPIVPIIKEMNAAKPQGEDNKWPSYSREKKEELKDKLKDRVGALLNKTLPFGWIGEKWVLITIILVGLLVIAGEVIKVARTEWDHLYLFWGMRIGYVHLLEVVLSLTFVVLLTLRIGRGMIQTKIVKTAHKMFLSEIKKWGIRVEK